MEAHEKSNSSTTWILCEYFEPFPLKLILHPKQWWIRSVIPKEINHMSEMTKPTTTVNEGDCRKEPDQKVVNETTLKTELFIQVTITSKLVICNCSSKFLCRRLSSMMMHIYE